MWGCMLQNFLQLHLCSPSFCRNGRNKISSTRIFLAQTVSRVVCLFFYSITFPHSLLPLSLSLTLSPSVFFSLSHISTYISLFPGPKKMVFWNFPRNYNLCFVCILFSLLCSLHFVRCSSLFVCFCYQHSLCRLQTSFSHKGLSDTWLHRREVYISQRRVDYNYIPRVSKENYERGREIRRYDVT